MAQTATLYKAASARRSLSCRSWTNVRHWQQTRINSVSTDEAKLHLGTLAAKTRLRELCAQTDRGRITTSTLRGEIAEAQIALEAQSPAEADFTKLPGLWRVIYTESPDTKPALSLNNPLLGGLRSPLKVGSLLQEFSPPETGFGKNIIKFGLTNVFEDDGITATVRFRYEISGSKRLSLQFIEGSISDVRITPFVESLLAPAILPRGGFNHQLLLAIREFVLRIPVRKEDEPMRDTAGTLLSFLDDDMLILRQLDQGGTAILNKESTSLDSST